MISLSDPNPILSEFSLPSSHLVKPPPLAFLTTFRRTLLFFAPPPQVLLNTFRQYPGNDPPAPLLFPNLRNLFTPYVPEKHLFAQIRFTHSSGFLVEGANSERFFLLSTPRNYKRTGPLRFYIFTSQRFICLRVDPTWIYRSLPFG